MSECSQVSANAWEISLMSTHVKKIAGPFFLES